MIFESHAHYDDEKFNEDRDFLLHELFGGRICSIINVGASIESTKATIALAEKYEKMYDLRPGTGLAFPQLGKLKRIIVIVDEYESGKFNNYVVVNPEIISSSKEIIAADAGEGCLSVNREVEGHVPRFARVTVTGFDMDGNPVRIRAREELSIAFQHEIDHLNGILFYDRINKKKPFFHEYEIRLI